MSEKPISPLRLAHDRRHDGAPNCIWRSSRSVQREGDQIRVTAQLIDAASDAHLWSEHWDRPSKEFKATGV